MRFRGLLLEREEIESIGRALDEVLSAVRAGTSSEGRGSPTIAENFVGEEKIWRMTARLAEWSFR